MAYTPDALPWEPTIYNVTMTLADTEYSQQLPVETMKVLMHTRDESAWRLAFETGIVAGPVGDYLTILANTRYYENWVNLRPRTAAWDGTVYFASPSADKVMEILVWTPRVI